jgi:hypothetical protein
MNTSKTELSVSRTETTGKETTITSRKITNGYILSKRIYVPGTKTKDGKYKESTWTTEETYFENDPLMPEDERTLAEIFKETKKK